MSAAETIAELPRLTPTELAHVRAMLDELTGPARASMPPLEAAWVRSPRLADPGRAGEFVKVVTEIAPDAGV